MGGQWVGSNMAHHDVHDRVGESLSRWSGTYAPAHPATQNHTNARQPGLLNAMHTYFVVSFPLFSPYLCVQNTRAQFIKPTPNPNPKEGSSQEVVALLLRGVVLARHARHLRGLGDDDHRRVHHVFLLFVQCPCQGLLRLLVHFGQP